MRPLLPLLDVATSHTSVFRRSFVNPFVAAAGRTGSRLLDFRVARTESCSQRDITGVNSKCEHWLIVAVPAV